MKLKIGLLASVFVLGRAPLVRAQNPSAPSRDASPEGSQVPMESGEAAEEPSPADDPRNASGWLEFLAIREDILLHVMRIIEEAGIQIAFPSLTTYLGRDALVDPATKEVAAQEVRRWEEEGRFPFPDPPEAEQDRLRGTLEYPPKSAAPRPGRPKED